MKYYITLALQLFFLAHIFATLQPTIAKAQDYANKVSWAFEEHKGQVTGADSAKVRYFYKQGNLTMFLLQKGIAYQFEKLHYPEGYKEALKGHHTRNHLHSLDSLNKLIRRETYRMDIELIGANPYCEIIAEGKSADYIQYYNHNALDVHAYQKIIYKNIYPNIDWVIYQSQEASSRLLEVSKNSQLTTSNSQLIKYDFIVHPGGNPTDIKLKTHWTENTQINPDGSLTLSCSMGTVTEQSPVSYQEGRDIKTQFSLKDNIIQFDIKHYNKSKTLTIDPFVRIWGTYYGGTDSEYANSTEIDKWSNVYSCGIAFSSTNIAYGGHQNSASIYGNAFLVKFDPCGVRIWGTYYGGENGSNGLDCSLDTFGNVILCGFTSSETSISYNGHQNSYGGGSEDGFIVKFNSNGIRKWATYYGGNKLDWSKGIKIDNNNIYIAGRTYSTSQIAHNGFKNSLNAFNLEEAFLVKFDSNGVRQWATYYGGNFGASATDCAVDNAQNVYLLGATSSGSSISYNGFQNVKGNNNAQPDAYLVKFDKDGNRQWATYYGGDSADNGYAIDIDKNGDIYIVGSTNSSNFSTFSAHQSVIGGQYDAYLVKFNTNGNRLWASLYGGNKDDYGYDIDFDKDDNVYLAGTTYSSNGISFNGYQNSFGGKADAFAVKLDKNGVRQWGTYYGGVGEEFHNTSMGIDTAGAVYLSGSTDSSTNLGYNGFKNSFTPNMFEETFLVKLYNAPTSLAPTITIQSPNGDFACEGSVKTFSAAVTNAGIKPKYRWMRNGLVVGSDTNILTLTQVKDKDTIQCRMISNLLCFTFDTVWSNPIILRVRSADTLHIHDTMCERQSYWFNNQNVFTSGLYRDTFTSSQGCDSFVFLHLHVKDTSYYAFLHTTPCDPNASYMFNGLARTQSGTYSAKYLNAVGCDSMSVLNLTVRKPTTYTIPQITICPGASYYFNGQPRTSEGMYTQILTNSQGCDSTVTLNLKVLTNPATISNPIQGCTPFTFEGKTYTSSITFKDTLKSTQGCDSVFRTNILQLKPTATKAPDTNIIVCDSIRISNKLYTASFHLIDTFRTQGVTQCDSLYRKTSYIIRYTPQIGLKERDTFMRGAQVTLRPFSATNYLWSTGETTQNISFKLTEDRQFYLIAWNEEPCRDTAYISLVAEDLAIVGMPTGFSPTGEHSENRTLKPNVNGRLEYLHLMIFNRWGEKVYETFDPQPIGWNGIFKGQPAPAGLYGYVMEYRTLGVIYTKSGEVMLVR